MYTHERDEAYFAAVGRLVVAWASLEMALDIMIDIIHRALGGNALEPERPRALQRKLTYLRRYFRSLKMPDDGLQGFLRLLQEIENLSETRHDIIHGAVLEQAEGSGEANLLRFLHKDGLLEHKHLSTNTATVLTAANQAVRLANKTFEAVNGLQEGLIALSRSSGAQNP